MSSLYVLVSPVQKYRLIDTGRRVTPPIRSCSASCVPARSELLEPLLPADEHIASDGTVWKSVPAGPPTCIRLSPIHAMRDCQHLNRPDHATNAKVIELRPEDLENPIFDFLPCCRTCGKAIIGRPEAAVELAALGKGEEMTR